MAEFRFQINEAQQEFVLRAARELRRRFSDPMEGILALSMVLVEGERVTADSVRVSSHFGASPPTGFRSSSVTASGGELPVREIEPGTYWTRRDGFVWTDAPAPPVHFVAYGGDGPIACLGLTSFPDGVEYHDQWTPNAVLRAFQKVHADLWDDVVRIALEPMSKACFCGRT